MRKAAVRVAALLLALAKEAAALDDWSLVRKYCPLHKGPEYLPLRPGHETMRFYIYRDQPCYERTFQRAFETHLGGRQRGGYKHEKESEFYGELKIWCELFMHPARTWDPLNATLFFVPALPTLMRETTHAVAEALNKEPAWRASRGSDHVVVCTHWACASRLGALFEMVARPGFMVALERNAKWLDPRVHRVDLDKKWAVQLPQPLKKGAHPLCPERTVVLPYPPHHGIMDCRPREHHHHSPPLPPPPRATEAEAEAETSEKVFAVDSSSSSSSSSAGNERPMKVFFSGALRTKFCGLTKQLTFVEPSHGVRPALSADNLLLQYQHPNDDDGADNLDLTAAASLGNGLGRLNSRWDFTGLDSGGVVRALHKEGYHLETLASALGGGGRVAGAGNAGKLSYPDMVRRSEFCLHLRGDTVTSRRFYDAIAAGCLPLVVSDDFGAALPFLLGGEVDYSAWLTTLSEADFVRDPLGAIDGVAKRFGLLGQDEGGRKKNELDAMRAAMAADAGKLTLCSGSGQVGDQLVRDLFLRQQEYAKRLPCEHANCLHNSSLQSPYALQTYASKRDMRAFRAERSEEHEAHRDERQCFGGNEHAMLPLYATEPDYFDGREVGNHSAHGSAHGRAAAAAAAGEGQLSSTVSKQNEADSVGAAAGIGAKWVAATEARLGTNWTWCVEVGTAFEDYFPTAPISDHSGNVLNSNLTLHVS